MSPDFFNQVAERISLRELSLKQAAEDFSKHSSRKDTMACIMQIVPGHISSQEIVTAYPGKFSSEVLDTFAGAVVTKGTENEKGKSLQDYCKNILSGSSNDSPKFNLEECEKFQNLNLASFPACETMVINCNNLSPDQILQLKALKADKISMNLVLLLSDQDVKMNVFCELSTDLGCLKEIFFTAESQIRKGDFVQNMKLGILSSPIIFKPPLKSFNGHINKLVAVVNQITPPGGKCIFINEGNLPIISIHDTHRCMYLGERSALEKFNMSLKKVGEAIPANVVLEVEKRKVDTTEEEIPKKDTGTVPSSLWSEDLEKIGARLDYMDDPEEKFKQQQQVVETDEVVGTDEEVETDEVVEDVITDEDDIKNSEENVKKEFNSSYGSFESDKK